MNLLQTNYSTKYRRVNSIGNGLAVLVFSLCFATASNAQTIDPQSGEALSRSNSLQNQIDAVAEFKAQHEAYDPGLIDLLMRLAETQRTIGDYYSALLSLDEAMQNSRINNGLYHESQFEMLDGLIANAISVENWPAVNNYYDYMQLLSMRLYQIDDPRLEIGLRKVSDWHVSAFNEEVDDRSSEHLDKMRRIFDLRLQVAENTLDKDDPTFNYLHQSIAIAEEYLTVGREEQKQLARIIGPDQGLASPD